MLRVVNTAYIRNTEYDTLLLGTEMSIYSPNRR